MTDQPSSTPRFAPVWPHANEVPLALQSIVGPNRVSVFNRGLTNEELEPLVGDFQTPCGKAFKVLGHIFLWLFVAQGCLWAAVFVLDAIFNVVETSAEVQGWITAGVTGGLNAARYAALAIIGLTIPALVILYTVHYRAWMKWRASIADVWERAGDRLVRTKSLPGKRREHVNVLGGKLDTALRRLNPENAEHSQLASEAVEAMGRYIDLPEPAKGAQAVAESPWQDEAVQAVRSAYEASQAAEQLALAEAKEAVAAVETLAREVKAAAAEKKIVRLAQRILENSPA